MTCDYLGGNRKFFPVRPSAFSAAFENRQGVFRTFMILIRPPQGEVLMKLVGFLLSS
jgi:hypothetical protein